MDAPTPRFEHFRAYPSHWILGVIYFCPEDPRVVVVRNPPWGWTLNFARLLALPFLLLLIVVCTAPVEAWLGPALGRFELLIKFAACCVLMWAANRLSLWRIPTSTKNKKP